MADLSGDITRVVHLVDVGFKKDPYLGDTSAVSVRCTSQSQIPGSIVQAFSRVPDMTAALDEIVKIAPREYSMESSWSLSWQWPPIQNDTPADWSALKSVAVSDLTANQLRLILKDPQGDKLRVSPSGGCSWFIHRDIETLSQASAVLFTAATAMRSAIDGMWYVEPMSGQCYPVNSDVCTVHHMQREIGDLADAVNGIKLSVEAEDREFRSHLLTVLVFGGGALTGLFFGVKEILKHFGRQPPPGGGNTGDGKPTTPPKANPPVPDEDGDAVVTTTATYAAYKLLTGYLASVAESGGASSVTASAAAAGGEAVMVPWWAYGLGIVMPFFIDPSKYMERDDELQL